MLAQPWSGAWPGAWVRRRVDPLGSGAPWASNTKHPKLDATYPWEALGHLGGGRRRAKAMLECRRGESSCLLICPVVRRTQVKADTKEHLTCTSQHSSFFQPQFAHMSFFYKLFKRFFEFSKTPKTSFFKVFFEFWGIGPLLGNCHHKSDVRSVKQ